jgi:hypothetical protein
MKNAEVSEAALIGLKDSYGAPFCAVEGKVRSSLFHPADYALWRVFGQLEKGTEVRWSDEHGDEGIYLLEGVLDVGGSRVTAGSVVIVESGVPARAVAIESASLLHLGSLAGRSDVEGKSVHVVDPSSAVKTSAGNGTQYWFSDGTCPTCRIVLFVSDHPQETGYVAASHTHSQDEIIHILDGEIQVGRHRVAAGMSIAVPKGVRYGFRSQGPFRFLNFRKDVSLYTAAPGSTPIIETAEAVRNQMEELG